MYIVTYECEIDNQKNYEIKITPPKGMEDFFMAAENINYHCYHIEYRDFHHEIICPKYMFADGNYVVVIPWFLIPGRPYPIQIYLFACSFYSSNQDIGQRGAAQATRDEFKLKYFSYSTVSRSFKAFEQTIKQSLEHRFGEEVKVCGTEIPNNADAVEKIKVKNDEAPNIVKSFPCAVDMTVRRKKMAVFFQEFLYCAKKEENIETASRQFVESWHKKTKKLLL